MKDWLINLLFRLLGSTTTRVYRIQNLFGVTNPSHEARKARWEKALVRLWKDKDLLDFLFYQAESDKERVFGGKLHRDLNRGARIRTLFIVYSARRAFLEFKRGRVSRPDDKDAIDAELREVEDSYSKTVDISS